MIDNINLIKPLLNFTDEDKFYFLQILKRKKDDANNKSSSLIKAYYICSEEYLTYKFEEIKTICDTFNARAYIDLNRRSYKKVLLRTMSYIAQCIELDQNMPVEIIHNRVIGKQHDEENKSWILDIDEPIDFKVNDLIKHITLLRPEGNKSKAIIPIKNGVHIICNPFDLNNLDKKYQGKFDIHKNNPTLLYIGENHD